MMPFPRLIRQGKQYTTVYGGYVGTYKNEDGDTELVDNTLVKPEEADTPASEEAQEASSVVATEEKEEKTEVYQNKANDYAILFRNRCQKRMV